MYPPLTTLSKACSESFTLPPSNNNSKPLKVEEGTPITIPVYSLHNDEKYFPNPQCFDPDRFSSENNNNIVKYSYLPFGEGPRICVGKRIFKALFSRKKFNQYVLQVGDLGSSRQKWGL